MAKCNDLTGQVFGFLRVIERAENARNGRVMWLCECSCSEDRVTVRADHLKSGATTSCGCVHKESARLVGKSNLRYGDRDRPNRSRGPTYNSWSAMKRRCTDSLHEKWPIYGGRGISVCDRWLESFENFLEDLGERPAGTSIDRIDNDLGYFKENCKWSTPKEQANNRRKRSSS